MSTFDYATLQTQTVEPLLKEFGKAAILNVNPADTGDPWDSQIDGAPLEYPITVVQTMLKKYDAPATLMEVGDLAFIGSTEGVSIDPALADSIVVDNVKYQVIDIKPLKPGDVLMLWKILARK